jgi:hypothetical protein
MIGLLALWLRLCFPGVGQRKISIGKLLASFGEVSAGTGDGLYAT